MQQLESQNERSASLKDSENMTKYKPSVPFFGSRFRLVEQFTMTLGRSVLLSPSG